MREREERNEGEGEEAVTQRDARGRRVTARGVASEGIHG